LLLTYLLTLAQFHVEPPTIAALLYEILRLSGTDIQTPAKYKKPLARWSILKTCLQPLCGLLTHGHVCWKQYQFLLLLLVIIKCTNLQRNYD